VDYARTLSISGMRLPKHPIHSEPPPISTALARLVQQAGDRIRVGDMVDGVGGRGLGLVLIVFALPETIPMIGTSLILAIPIALVGGHMMVHGESVFLPRRVRSWTIKRKLLEPAVRRMLPLLRWAERKARPRFPRLTAACRTQGAVALLMAAILAIPIPGLNILAAFAVFGIGLGILFRDGRMIALAFTAAATATLGIAAILIGAITLAT
jgi:hypothetical protein